MELKDATGDIGRANELLHRLPPSFSIYSGDVATVRSMSRRMATINQALFIEYNPIPVKWAMARMGLILAGMRLPLTPLSTASFAMSRLIDMAGLYSSATGSHPPRNLF